jgi:hypothetical protein
VVRPEIHPSLTEYSVVTVSVSPLVGYVRSVQSSVAPAIPNIKREASSTR